MPKTVMTDNNSYAEFLFLLDSYNVQGDDLLLLRAYSLHSFFIVIIDFLSYVSPFVLLKNYYIFCYDLFYY
jgi:hypothetical protein